MADEVLDILTRFSFEAADSTLDNVNAKLTAQSNIVTALEAKIAELEAQRASDASSSKKQLEEINAAYEKMRKALENLKKPAQEQIGLIGKLQNEQKRLQQQLTDASSRNEIKRINQELRETESQLQKLNGLGRGGALSGIGEAFKQGLGFAGGFGLVSIIGQGIGAIKDFAKESFQAAADFEQLTVSFNTLLGSRDKATKLLQDLQQFAQVTPFKFTDLTNLSKQLLAFGFSADEIIPSLQMLGDVAGGVGADKLPNIVYAFGQIRTNGKLMGQDLLQLVNAGFNPLQEIATKTGKSITQLRKDMEAGKITFKDVEGAFKTATSAGGRFFNLMQAQSQTTSGAVSNLGDAVDQLKIQIGASSTGPVKAFVTGLSDMVNGVKEFISLDPAQKVREQQFALQNLVGALQETNVGEETRNALMSQLRAQYPDFLGNLKNEEVTTRLLSSRLADVNEQYDRRIKLINATKLVEGVTQQNQKNITTQSEAAVIGAAVRNTGINKPLDSVTTADVRKLTTQQRNNILAALDQSGYFPATGPLYIGEADKSSLIATTLERVAKNNKEAIANQATVNKGLSQVLKDQEKAKQEADPLAILEEQNKRDVDAIKDIKFALERFKQKSKSKSDIEYESYKSAFLVEDKQKAINIRQDQIDKLKKEAAGPVTDPAAAAKGANTLVDELKKKYAELLVKEAEYQKKSDRITSESIKAKINAQTKAAIDETNIREAAAVRDGKQTAASATLFNQIRAQIRKNGDLQYAAENKAFLDKLEKDQTAFNLSLRKLELQLALDRLKLRTDDLDAQRAAIAEAGELSALELNDQYDKLAKQASDLALSAGKSDIEAVARVEEDRKVALIQLRQRTNQALYDADIKNYETANKAIHEALDLQLLETKNFINAQLKEIKRLYDEGEISYSTYLRRRKKINEQTPFIELSEKQISNQKELSNAQAELERAQNQRYQGLYDRTAPIITDADITALKKKVEELKALTDEYKKAEKELKIALIDKRVNNVVGIFDTVNAEVSAIGNAANQIIEIEKNKTDRIIAEQQRRVDAAKENAQTGNAAVLKAEEDRLEKLAAAERKYAQEQATINAALVISQNILNVARAVGAVVTAAAKGGEEGGAVGLVVSIVAAVAALAAGILSATTAVKSIETGYYVGGYTGEGDPREEAGPVHKKEFVFDHKATARIGKDNLEALRYGRLELVAPNNYGPTMRLDYTGMQRDTSEIRQMQFNNQFDTRRLEQKMHSVVEAIDNIPTSSFTADARGMAVSIQGHIKHIEKLKNL